ncbi:hypothetical protein FBZ93_101842 [Bradyrhizobium macuxiense]|uniref:Transmembrane protein n=1 Tax=Bradyrhizobium macuxiense TaxID=1755647 RepID=A0A560MJP7_9BRAD|nr:EscU/YscU/HrcU family type III secretion system export apparatus switch protein [Bradyrhizobium macuxiense]TWC07549.1 hypothetical protein FBZ93_101842 [Bradyrhizobium macuxiense]
MIRAYFNTETTIAPARAWMHSILGIIGPDLRGGDTETAPDSANSNWIAALCLVVAVALLLVAAGQGAGRRGNDVAPLLFWSGTLLVVVPTSLRIAWPNVARGERLFLLVLLVGALFFHKTMYSPTGFAHHDEYLHWIAAEDLTTARRLFLSNPLLPIASVYPALEIVTTAITNLTGLPIFATATLLLAVLKGTLITALFLFYERITGSPRIAAIACLTYMGCSTFVVFESIFSYESIAFVLCILILAVEAASKDLVGRSRSSALILIALLVASLAVAHHLTAAFVAFYLGMLAALEASRRDVSLRVQARIAMGATAALAIVIPLVWVLAHGNPFTGYVGPVVETGFKALLAKLMGTSTPQSEHVSPPSQPILLRLTTLLAILLTSVGLATGFFRSLAMTAPVNLRSGWRPIQGILKRRWRDSRVVLLTLLACGFPISVAFRLTVNGWQIGNRMGTFVFIGVGLVFAVGIVHFWQGRGARGWRLIVPPAAISVIVMGGVTAGSIEPIRGPYKVSSDAQSIERMGIETSLWTKEWLGPGNRFTSDRVNRLLLAGYGRQDVRNKINPAIYAARVFRRDKLGADDFYALARSDLDFLVVDLRLTTAPPVLGFYFEPWEPQQGTQLTADELLKFNDVKGVSRTFDNGYLIIYDLRGLHGEP